MSKPILSASMMCSELVNLKEVISIFEECNIDYLHIDVMDGEFVPNFGLGVDYIRGLRKLTNIPLDIHLMIKNPEYKLSWLGIKNTDIVTIHYESTFQVQRALDWLKPFGCKCFLAINPATPIYSIEEVLDYIDGINVLMVNPGFSGQKIIPSTLDKVERLIDFLKKKGKSKIIEVDGNINNENGKILRRLGASMFVCGTSCLFKGDISDYRDNIYSFRRELEKIESNFNN